MEKKRLECAIALYAWNARTARKKRLPLPARRTAEGKTAMIEYRQTPSAGDAGSAFGLARELALSPQIAELLCRRGCDTPEAAREFLNPSIERLHDPFLFNGMQDAVDCIFAALANDELFCVYGDYDVDGVMAVTILVRQLKSMGARVVPYIPSRHTEGYGLTQPRSKASPNRVSPRSLRWIAASRP